MAQAIREGAAAPDTGVEATLRATSRQTQRGGRERELATGEKAMDRSTHDSKQNAADPTSTRAQIHELRNRLYASSLAFRAICRLLDSGQVDKARIAAETMLAKVNGELHESRDDVVDQRRFEEGSNALKVLLVEDDDMEAHLLSAQMAELGYQVIHVRDGIAALQQLKLAPLPDVVLLDMNMPRLDGPKTVTSIRSNTQLKDLTLIAVSGSDATSANMQKARRNVDFWITKPADPERIVGAIRELTRT